MSLPPLHFGILGFGKQAREVMAPALSETHCAKLIAAATRNQGCRKKLKAEFRGILFFEDFKQLLSEEKVEAVYIGLANHLHNEWTQNALNAGKHVLCDKPLCLTYQEAVEMNACAKKNSCVLAEAFAYRFHPQHQKVKNLLKEGVIGTLESLTVEYSYFLEDPKNFRADPSSGGGALYDIGCYGIDLSRFLLEEEPICSKAVSKIHPKWGVDIKTDIQLVFPSKVEAKIHCSCEAERKHSYRVTGTEGEILVQKAFHVSQAQKTKVELRRKKSEPVFFEIEPTNQFANEIEAFVQLVQGEEEGSSQFLENGIKNMKIISTLQENTRRSERI